MCLLDIIYVKKCSLYLAWIFFDCLQILSRLDITKILIQCDYLTQWCDYGIKPVKTSSQPTSFAIKQLFYSYQIIIFIFVCNDFEINIHKCFTSKKKL